MREAQQTPKSSACKEFSVICLQNLPIGSFAHGLTAPFFIFPFSGWFSARAKLHFVVRLGGCAEHPPRDLQRGFV
jgi:hypothetical protein